MLGTSTDPSAARQTRALSGLLSTVLTVHSVMCCVHYHLCPVHTGLAHAQQHALLVNIDACAHEHSTHTHIHTQTQIHIISDTHFCTHTHAHTHTCCMCMLYPQVLCHGHHARRSGQIHACPAKDHDTRGEGLGALSQVSYPHPNKKVSHSLSHSLTICAQPRVCICMCACLGRHTAPMRAFWVVSFPCQSPSKLCQ